MYDDVKLNDNQYLIVGDIPETKFVEVKPIGMDMSIITINAKEPLLGKFLQYLKENDIGYTNQCEIITDGRRYMVTRIDSWLYVGKKG